MSTKLNLSVVIMKEGDNFVAFTPALDLSTYGKTLKEAQRNFTEAVTIFFEELKEMGTTDEVLKGLGWTEVKKEFLPPTIISHTTESFPIALTC